MPLSRDDCVFFWKPDTNNGWASQWYYSPFKARIRISTPSGAIVEHDEETEFLTTEHWMMACKALVFGDREVFEEVLAADAADMRAVKALGRKVQGFDDGVWNGVREEIVFRGNFHKFGQNEELKGWLLDTGNKMFIEASPRDRIWGIGFGEKRALEVVDRWGLNLLGKALVRVREALRSESQEVEGVE